jgi:hypothetical protein
MIQKSKNLKTETINFWFEKRNKHFKKTTKYEYWSKNNNSWYGNLKINLKNFFAFVLSEMSDCKMFDRVPPFSNRFY